MTLFQFYKKFDTDEKCFDYLAKLRWPEGVICPYCGRNRHYVLKGEIKRSHDITKAEKDTIKNYKCANNKCYKKFNILSSTIFSYTKAPLWQFFYLIFSSVINKKNVSSFQQALNLGISQKTCWYTMLRIRMLCWQDENIKLLGEVEVDETYLALEKWKRPKWQKTLARRENTPVGRKLPVLGLIERGGRIVVKPISQKDKRTVQDMILKYVEVDSRLITDSAACYIGINSYYIHDVINHKDGEYVRGDVHTNSIENFWFSLKNAIRGTHHGVSKLHLGLYCDELAYRWNNRHKSPLEKFNDLLERGLKTKPKKYKKVTGALAEMRKNKPQFKKDVQRNNSEAVC